MVNHKHNNEYENDTPKPRSSWASLLVGLLTGLLIGGLAGAVAMLLLAPHSGKRTRSKLRRQSNELREQTAETVEDVVVQARDKTHQITHDVRKQVEEFEHRGHAILDEQKGR